MLIIDGSLFFTLLFFAIPVLAVRDIIRAIRKSKRKRDIERLERKCDAIIAKAEKDYQEFKQWEEEHNRRREEHYQRIRELEAAVEAASDPDERIAAMDRLFAERMGPW